MNSETSNDGNEATTPPRDETPSPEGSGLFEICVTLTKEDKPVIVPKSGAIPSSPASACLSSTVGPVESESPYNEDSFYELLALFRKEFEKSMRRDGNELRSRSDEWPEVETAIIQVLEESQFDYKACFDYMMICSCDFQCTDEGNRFVIPSSKKSPTNSLGDMVWMNRNYILGSEVATRGGNPPLGKKAPLYVGDKMIDPGD